MNQVAKEEMENNFTKLGGVLPKTPSKILTRVIQI